MTDQDETAPKPDERLAAVIVSWSWRKGHATGTVTTSGAVMFNVHWKNGFKKRCA